MNERNIVIKAHIRTGNRYIQPPKSLPDSTVEVLLVRGGGRNEYTTPGRIRWKPDTVFYLPLDKPLPEGVACFATTSERWNTSFITDPRVPTEE